MNLLFFMLDVFLQHCRLRRSWKNSGTFPAPDS